MHVKVRLATRNDVPALRELIRESVTTLSAQAYTPSQIASALAHVCGVDSQLIADKTYYVAEVGQRVVGSGGWSKRTTMFGGDQSKSGLNDSLLDPASAAARIRAFYVHPDWARKGIASLILTKCEAAARRAGFASVELVATLPGEPLYSARGYKKAEPMQIETPNGLPLPAFRMTKTLARA
jgi:predicted N-acetyltransferase YhbS